MGRASDDTADVQDQKFIGNTIPYPHYSSIVAKNLNIVGPRCDTIQKTAGRELGIGFVKETLVTKC